MSCAPICRASNALQAAQEEIRLIKEERDKYRVALAKQRALHTEDRIKIAEMQTLLEEVQSELSDLKREKREREVSKDSESEETSSVSKYSRQSTVEDPKEERSDTSKGLLGDILQAFGETNRYTPSSPPKSKRPSDYESASAPPKTPKRLRPTLDDKKTKAIPNTVRPAVEVYVKVPPSRQKTSHEPPATTKGRKPRTCITCRQTGCKGSFVRKQCPRWVEVASDKSDVTPTSAEE